MSVRTQTRTTTAFGDPVPDNLWTITSDSGVLVAPPPPPPIPGPTFSDSFSDTYDLSTDGTTSPNGKWLNKFGGYGKKGANNGFFYQFPKTSTSPGETHASLTLSTVKFTDFQLDLDMKTVQQLRQNSKPNSWETAWIHWHYTDSSNFYSLVLKTSGFQIEKKDGSITELFLVTNSTPKVTIGTYQHLKLIHTNSTSNTPRIQVWVDGTLAADYIDNVKYQPNNPILQSGVIGLYCEDSVVNFDNVAVTAL